VTFFCFSSTFSKKVASSKVVVVLLGITKKLGAILKKIKLPFGK
jgi:hypothetical protein